MSDHVTDEQAAKVLANGHPKSKPPKIHKGMEGERKGLPHLTPVSSRFINAHTVMGTKVSKPGSGP